MKALVLGLGISGKSAQSLLERRGVEVVGIDDCEWKGAVVDLAEFDLFVPSPGIPQRHPLYQEALKRGMPIKGEVELFLEETDQMCIGITGTNGKTTTALMITHLLNRSARRAVCAGNIGIPLASVERDVICILELSSFQLEAMQAQRLDLGVILNISADHLDRYPSFEAYRDTKISLQRRIKEGGKLFVHESLDPLLFSHPIDRFSGGGVEVAMAIGREMGIDDFSPLESFQKPAHRLERVEAVAGVTYINDSKATNVAATRYALSQFDGNVILILGGRDKGLSFASLLEEIQILSSVIICGEAREKIADELQALSKVYVVETLKEAVDLAATLAKRGDIVLFSPGCASLDAFENYEKRGKAFKDYVRRRMQ